jgi:transcriptional regulator with XRE-family HTH domain
MVARRACGALLQSCGQSTLSCAVTWFFDDVCELARKWLLRRYLYRPFTLAFVGTRYSIAKVAVLDFHGAAERYAPILDGTTGTRRMRFGEELKIERERRGISLDDVAVSTRVSLRHLHALEADNFRELPGGVFNRGIVRSYAEHCGLDVGHTVESFQRALRESGVETELKDDDWIAFAEAVRRGREKNGYPNKWRWAGVAGMVVAVLAMAVGVVWLLARRGIVHLPVHTRYLALGAVVLPVLPPS